MKLMINDSAGSVHKLDDQPPRTLRNKGTQILNCTIQTQF